jgi:hypothetical protein
LRRSIALGLCFAAALSRSATGQVECADYRDYLHWAGGVWTRSAFAVEISGAYAYVADGVWGLTVLDIADPTQPVRVRSLAMPDAAVDLALVAKRAYVIDGLGLSIFDLTLPADPALLGRVDLPPRAGKWEGVSLATAQDLVFVLRGGDRWIVDARDPTRPFVVNAELEPTGAADFEIRGDYLYSLDQHDLSVYDIADPLRPQLSGSYSGEFSGVDLCLAGGFAYVVGDSTLSVFDVTVPWRPLRLSSIALNVGQTSLFAVEVFGSRAVVMTNQDVVLVDVADPRNPRLLGRIESTWTRGLIPTGLALTKDHAYLTHLQPGLIGTSAGRVSVVALADSYVLEPLATRASIQSESAVVGTTLYGVGFLGLTGDPHFLGLDVSDPTLPQPLGFVPLGGIAGGSADAAIAVLGSTAFVVQRKTSQPNELLWIDIADPMQPLIRYRLAGDFWDVAASADRVVVAHGAAGLGVLDLGLSGSLAIAAVADTPGEAIGVALVGQLAVVADGAAGVSLVDVSDPFAPLWRETIPSAGTASSVDVAGEIAWVADGFAGLTAIALAGPAASQILGGWDTAEYVNDVDLRGGRAYVMEQGIGLHVLDIADPAMPSLIGGVAIESGECGSNGVSLGEQFLYLSDSCLGLAVYPLACDATVPALVRRFEVESSSAGRRIRWTLAEAAGRVEFRLLVADGGAERPLVYATDGAGGYEAWDRTASARASAVYSLFARAAGAQWSLLAQERVQAEASSIALRLRGASPNPFHPNTTIRFELSQASAVDLEVFDLAGRLVRRLLVGESFAGGAHAVPWDGRDERAQSVSSGVYVCRLQAAGAVRSQRLTLLP